MSKKVLIGLLVGAVVAIVILAISLADVGPQPPEEPAGPADFYRGKTVRLVVPFGPGGGTDIQARHVASFLSEKLEASVIVQNMPGGGGLVGFNHVYNLQPVDGLTMLFTGDSALFPAWVTEADGVNYDIGEFEYIAGLNPTNFMLVTDKAGKYNSLEALLAAEGLKDAEALPDDAGTWAILTTIEILGLDCKVVTGYGGTAAMFNALLGGEVDLNTLIANAAVQSPYIDHLVPLLCIHNERDPLFPDVPTIGDVTEITESDQRLLDLVTYVTSAKVVAVPPGTPADRVEFLREAFDEMDKDGELEAVFKRTIGDYVYFTGDKIASLASDMAAKKAEYEIFGTLFDKYSA